MNHPYSEFLSEASSDTAYTGLLTAGELRTEQHGEYALPDYLPDLGRVLSVSGEARITGREEDGEVLRYQGETVYTVLLLTAEGKPAGFECKEPFQVSRELPAHGGSIRLAEVIPVCESITVKPVNARRIAIRGTVLTGLWVLEEQSAALKAETADGAPLSSDREKTVMTRQGAIPTLLTFTGGEKAVTVSEDFTLDGSAPPVREVVSSRITPVRQETRCGSGEAEVNAEFLFETLYEAEDGSYIPTERRLSLSRTVPVPGMEGDCFCMTRLYPGTPRVAVQADPYGARRLLCLDFPVDIQITGYAPKETAVTRDAYAAGCDSTAVYAPVRSVTANGLYETGLSVNGQTPRSEAGIEAGGRLLDSTVHTESVRFTVAPDKKKLLCEGVAAVTVVLLGREGEENGWQTGRYRLPFRAEWDGEGLTGDTTVEGVVRISAKRVRLEEEQIRTDLELAFQVLALEPVSVEAVQTLQIRGEAPEEARPGHMTVYYPEKDESLWSVAKRYRVRESELTVAGKQEHTVVRIPHRA